MSYHHLTEVERTSFHRLLQAGYSVAHAAALLDRHPSALYRERKRNGTRQSLCGQLTYDPLKAQAMHEVRARQANSRPRIEPWVYCAAYDLLSLCDLSPMQIADQLPISHETVYRWMYREIAVGADWQKHLRSGRVARHQRRYRRLADAARRSAASPIAERPEVCNLRLEFGHWEADLMLGRKDNCCAVLVVKERLSRLTLMCRVPNQRSKTVMRAMRSLLQPYQGQVKTMTTDNGSEFIRHQAFVAEFGCTMYRCEPHSPWQRGQVEGENKNLRQYMPKGFNADRLTNTLLKEVERKINMRPKRVLDNQSPVDVAHKLSGVALRF